MPALKHLVAVGQQFGFLTVVRQAASDRFGRRFLCRCACGTETEVAVNNLVGGTVKSCGCYRRGEAARIRHTQNTRHGHTIGRMSPEYRAWAGMKDRCLNPNRHEFPYYGGRGIRICDRWRESFEAFFEDMGHKPSPAHELDRFPDNDGDYEPGNVRWATRAEQTMNTRRNHFLTYEGRTQTVKEWAHDLGIRDGTLRNRLHRGWTVDRALSSH